MTVTNSSLRLVSLVTGVAVAIALMSAVAIAPAKAAGLTQTQISSIVSLLASFGADQATINNVTAALNGQATTGTGGSTGSNPNAGTCPALSRDIQAGSTGADVKSLQVFLNSMSDTKVSVSGAGSMGNETTTFGPATKAAVIKLQIKLGVTPAAGYVGAKTRAAIAATCGGSTGNNGGNTGGTTGGSVMVAAASQPVNSLAPASASRVPFTTFTITNNGSSMATVNSVTVQRTGIGVDANFSGIVLLDSNGLQIGTAKTLNSNHQANLDGFTLNAGESKTFTVAGNMANSSTAQSGQVVSLQVVAVNTGATVGGSLPISGASHTINTTLTLGSISTTTSSYDPGSTQTKSMGDTGVRFTGLRITAGSAEDIKFYSIRWRQVGTASASDIANIMTVVGDTAYPTTVSADGKYYTTVFPGGILVGKGNSIDVYVKGDLIGTNAASRTVDFDIDRGTDLYFVGQTYGYGVATPAGAQPWWNGYAVTIQAGTATTIGKANEVGAQNIAVNVSNQPLGGFATDFKGEPVSISGMTVTFATTTAASGLLTSVSVVDSNGSVVAGPVDTTWSSGVMTATFTDSITFPVGRKVYTLKGKVPSSASNGSTITASTVPSSTWTNPTGQVSGNNITLSTGSFSMNSMTVKGAALAVGVSATPASQTVTAGTTDLTMANIQLDASQSGEDVRISSLPLIQTGTITDVSSCRLMNGSTQLNTGSNVPTTLNTSGSATTFTLDNSLVIPKGTVVTLALKCNLSSSASGTYVWSLTSAGNAFSATGFTSGVSITETGTGTSGTFTVGNASIAVTVDASSPAYTLAAGGTNGVTMGIVKVRATNDNATLTKLGLILTSGTANSLGNVYIYDGSTLVGTASFSNNVTVATSTLSTPIALTKNIDKLLTIKADLADVGADLAGVEGALVKLDPSSSEANATAGLITTGATVGVSGVRVYNTFPTIVQDSLTTTGVNDGVLMRFRVTANSAGTLGIGRLTFTVATSSMSVSNVGLYAYSTTYGSGPVQTSTGLVDEVLATTTPYAAATCVTTGGSSCVSDASVTTFNIKPASTPIQVGASQTVYFELRGSVTGVVSGSSVVTKLLGDSAASPAGQLTSAYTAVSGNFRWTPQATTTPAFTNDVDWTNGFAIVGLPASGLIQTRSQ
jgi:hypothetical protein